MIDPVRYKDLVLLQARLEHIQTMVEEALKDLDNIIVPPKQSESPMDGRTYEKIHLVREEPSPKRHYTKDGKLIPLTPQPSTHSLSVINDSLPRTKKPYETVGDEEDE